MLALTKETFTPLINVSSRQNIYFNEQGMRKSVEPINIADSTLVGAFRKARTIATPTETIEELLDKHSSLTPELIEKAASFIRSCIRLNPADRLTRNELGTHPWMEYANRACADPDNHIHGYWRIPIGTTDRLRRYNVWLMSI
jgi:serine/threonine protein kinase